MFLFTKRASFFGFIALKSCWNWHLMFALASSTSFWVGLLSICGIWWKKYEILFKFVNLMIFHFNVQRIWLIEQFFSNLPTTTFMQIHQTVIFKSKYFIYVAFIVLNNMLFFKYYIFNLLRCDCISQNSK